jgi:hypothetical protein
MDTGVKIALKTKNVSPKQANARIKLYL